MGFVVVVLVIVAIAAVSHQIRLRNSGVVWRSAAAELGLAPPRFGFFKPFGIAGVVDGIHIQANEVSTDNKSGTTFAVRYRNLGLGLRVSEESAVDVASVPIIGRVLSGGREDVEFGDRAFDHTVRVRGYDADAVTAFLTPTRRPSLQRLIGHYPDAVVADDQIRWSTTDRPSAMASVVSPIRRFVAVALVMQGDGDQLNHAVDRLEAGELTGGLDELQVIDGPTRPEARMLQAEILASGAGTPAQVNEVLDELEVIVPADPELAALHDAVDHPPAAQPPFDDTTAEASRPDARAGQTLQLDELFGQSTADARAVFDARYAGKRVAGMGTVRRVSDYANDLDFGTGLGRRAVIRLGLVDLGPYGQAEIDAVVAFGPDVDLTADQDVAFTGIPIKLDGFSRNILLEAGELSS